MVGFSVNRQSYGMQNQGKNLMDEAVKLAKDGQLSSNDLNSLRNLAKSDGKTTVDEELFLAELGTVNQEGGYSGAKAFVELTKKADFDPKSLNFNTRGQKEVPVHINGNAHNIKLEFDNDPETAKQISGNIEAANKQILNLLGGDAYHEWNKVPKHDLSAVKAFMDKHPMTADKKAELVSAYLTTAYNHVGSDINWDGVDIQNGINAMPQDQHGRRYLDCEAFVKVSQTLLGQTGEFTPLSVKMTPESQGPDHQVAVMRSGGDAYLVNNDSIQRLPNGAGKTDEEIVQHFNPEYSDVGRDNVLMSSESSDYRVGQQIDMGGGAEAKILSMNAHDNSRMNTKYTTLPDDSGYVNDFHATVKINARTGGTVAIPDQLKAGDKIIIHGEQVFMTGPNAGYYEKDGERHNLQVNLRNEEIFTVPPLG